MLSREIKSDIDFSEIYDYFLDLYFEDQSQINGLKSLLWIHRKTLTTKYEDIHVLVDRVQESLEKRVLGTESGEFIMIEELSKNILYLDIPDTENDAEVEFITNFLILLIRSLGIGHENVKARKVHLDINSAVPNEAGQSNISKFLGCLVGEVPDYTVTQINGRSYTLLDVLRLIRCHRSFHNKYMKSRVGNGRYSNTYTASKLKNALMSSLSLPNCWYKRVIKGIINVITDPSNKIDNPIARSYTTKELSSVSSCMARLGYTAATVDIHKFEVAFASHFVWEEINDKRSLRRTQQPRPAFKHRDEIRAILILLEASLNGKSDKRTLREIVSEGNRDMCAIVHVLENREFYDDLDLLYMLIQASQRGKKKFLNLKRSANMRSLLISKLNRRDLIIKGEVISSLREVSPELISKITSLLRLTGDLYPAEDSPDSTMKKLMSEPEKFQVSKFEMA
jgi:hypothetical protein